MSTLELIRALSETPSRTEKEQLLMAAFMEGERLFFRGALLAYDPLISFGVKKAAEITEDDGLPGTLDPDHFFLLCEELRCRRLTGHAARDAIHDLAAQADTDLWNEFYRRVLLKDLKCGAEDSTINKVLKKLSQTVPEAKQFIIPIFECQLAHDGASDQHAKKIKGVKMLDIKLDGVRLLTVLDKETGTVTQYTRNGKINENFPEIREALTELLADLPGSIVLDGEIVGNSFQELMTQLNRKSKKNSANAKLAVFDIIPLDDFRKGYSAHTQKVRHEHLTSLAEAGLFQQYTGDSVYVVPKIAVDLDTPEGQAAFREFNRKAIEAEYEGIMVKDPESPYECKRSIAWLKIKPTIEVTLQVMAVEEGKSDGKYVGMMGALLCSGTEDGKHIVVNVGSGFTDEQRVEYWSRRTELIGFMVEVQADAITKSRDDDNYSLRFPRFKGWRGTVPGEKI